VEENGMVLLGERDIVFVFCQDNLSETENTLLESLREVYGLSRVKVFASLKRARAVMNCYPGFLVACFDGENEDHVDEVFDLFGTSELIENNVTRVLGVNEGMLLAEVEGGRFDHDQLVLLPEASQGEATLSGLRKVFGNPVMLPARREPRAYNRQDRPENFY